MFDLQFKTAKAQFFDRDLVMSRVDAATRRVLSKFGAFVRQRARTSIRNPPKRSTTRASAPGRPPYSHTGLLKQFIYFAYEPERHAVVIGPVRLRDSRGEAPGVLEYGGTARIDDRRSRRKRRVRIQPRPYMHPAFEAESRSLPELWKQAVRR